MHTSVCGVLLIVNGISFRESEIRDDMDVSPTDEQKKASLEFENLGKALSLCVAYSSSLGGLATLTGATGNAIFKGFFDTYALSPCDFCL